MKYQEQAEEASLGCGDHRVKICLNLDRVALLGQVQATCQTTNVSVHREPRKTQSNASHHVCGLTSDTGKRN